MKIHMLQDQKTFPDHVHELILSNDEVYTVGEDGLTLEMANMLIKDGTAEEAPVKGHKPGPSEVKDTK